MKKERNEYENKRQTNCQAPQGEAGYYQEAGRRDRCDDRRHGCRAPDDSIQPCLRRVVG